MILSKFFTSLELLDFTSVEEYQTHYERMYIDLDNISRGTKKSDCFMWAGSSATLLIIIWWKWSHIYNNSLPLSFSSYDLTYMAAQPNQIK
jgi:hypothetical protein